MVRLAAWTRPIAEAATFYPPWALGHFSEDGLDFTWISADGSPAALNLLEDGEAEIAFVSCLAFLQAVGRGARVLAVYNLFPRSCFVIFGPSGTTVRRPRDLAGKRVGVRSITSSGADWLRLALRLDGLTGDEVEPVVVGQSGVDLLLAGAIDGMVGSDAALYDARRAGLRDPFTFWLDALLPLPSDVLAVRAERLGELTAQVRRFLIAYRRGIGFAARHPGQAAEAIGRLAVDGDDPYRNRAMLALRLLLSEPHPGSFRGRFEFPGLRRSIDILAQHGIVPTPAVRVTDVFTNELVLACEAEERGDE